MVLFSNARGIVRYHLIVLIAALTLAVAASATHAQADAVASDEHPATVPADVQFQLLGSAPNVAPVPPPTAAPVPGSYVVPVPGPYLGPQPAAYNGQLAPGQYPNVPAGWEDYGSAQFVPAQPPPSCATAAQPTYCPKWYFDMQVMAINRDNYSRQQRILGNLSTDDLKFDGAAAPYLALGYNVDPHNQWQLIYFDGLGLSATGNANESGISSKTNYDSNFHSVELNYLHTWNHWSLLGGFRYLHLDEQFTIHATNFVDNLDFDQQTNNNLYGGQIGFAYHREWSWIMVDVTGKFGLYGNAASQHGTESFDGSPIGRINSHPNSLGESGEFDLFLGHRFSPHWVGRMGLVVLEVDNVALAPDMDVTNKADGNISLVGLTLGATAQW